MLRRLYHTCTVYMYDKVVSTSYTNANNSYAICVLVKLFALIIDYYLNLKIIKTIIVKTTK